ncbi:MAG: 4Fe-4S dicluster domain-containing protein [Coriobacteriales bacterium]|nr:4Fe-4S dicluster domain-containing protein [Coriobacteriales bacterium]
MARYGMLIDTRSCVGCYACLIACRRQNGLSPELSFIRFEHRERGSYPAVFQEVIPLQCMQCAAAPCVLVCPTEASYFGPDGLVGIDHGKCIGCKYCMVACPYQLRTFNEELGVADKCRFCAIQTLVGGKGCTCVEACLTNARVIGDLDDPNSEIVSLIESKNALPIAGDLTQANIFYVR